MTSSDRFPRRRGPLGLALGLVILTGAGTAGAQAAERQPAALKLAFARLELGGGRDGLAERLSWSLPDGLRERLSFVDRRFPLAEELDALDTAAALGERGRAARALADALAARERASLDNRDPFKRAAELRDAERKLREARRAISPSSGAAIEGASRPATGSAPPRSLSYWKDASLGIEARLAPIVSDPAEFCRASSVDYLVYGNIERLDGYFSIHLRLYSAPAGRDLWSETHYGADDEFENVVDAVERPLATALFGRAYTRLEPVLYPPTARLLDEGGRALSPGEIFFEPWVVEAVAAAPGFESKLLRFRIEPGRDLALRAALEPLSSPSFIIESDPPGASLYLDGVLLGLTPLELPGFAELRTLRLSLPGREDLRSAIQGSPPDGTLRFGFAPPTGTTQSERIAAAKDEFYQALGWFVLSLPVSTLSYGSFRMYYDASLAALDAGINDPAAIARLNTSYTISQAVFWTSSAVSLGLAINAGLRLARYLKAAR